MTSRREGKKIEMLFAHLKRILRLDRLRLRGPCGAHDEFLLAATAQTLRKPAKLIPMPTPPLRSGRSMPLFLWMSRRSSGMHQRTPNSWAKASASVRENRKSQLQLRVGFCVLGDRLLRDAHERRAPRLDRRPEGLERLQSRLHAGHHEPV